MSSRSETVIQALVDALTARSQGVNAPLPTPLRNEDLYARLEKSDAGLRRIVIVWDGASEVTEEVLGADLGDPIDEDAAGGYDIAQRPQIEMAIADGDPGARTAAFDAALIAIHDAVRPAIVDGNPVYLGGAVDYCAIESIEREGNLATDGMPGVRAAIVTVRLVFTSPRPF